MLGFSRQHRGGNVRFKQGDKELIVGCSDDLPAVATFLQHIAPIWEKLGEPDAQAGINDNNLHQAPAVDQPSSD